MVKIKTAYVFLEEIRKRFKEKYSKDEIMSAFAHGMNSSFAEIYKQQFVTDFLCRLTTTATRILIKKRS
jgi:hypothetical protein